MRTTTILAALAVATVTLTGCGTSVDETEAPYHSPAASSEVADRDVAKLAMHIAWSETPAEDQFDMCLAWTVAPDMVVDTLQGDVGNDIGLTASDVREFFEGKCDQ